MAGLLPFESSDQGRSPSHPLNSFIRNQNQSIRPRSRFPIIHKIWSGSRYSGIACMTVSSLSYSLMGLFVKLVSLRHVPSLQTVLVRCLVISVLAGAELRRMGHPLLGSKRARALVVSRAVIGFISLSAFFYSIQSLPLRDATVLNFTMPVFTALMASAILGETWGLAEMSGTLCSFAGVLLVTQPDLLFQSSKSVKPNYQESLGVLMALIGASTGALSYIILRAIGKLGEPPLVSVFVFAALSVPLSAIGCLFQKFKMLDSVDLMYVILVGVTAFLAQVFLTRGLQLEKAAKASSIQYVKVIGTYLLGVAFLHEVPTFLGVMGAGLIALSAAFLIFKS